MSAKIVEVYCIYEKNNLYREGETELKMLVFDEDNAKNQISKMASEETYFDPIEYDRVRINHDGKIGINFRKECKTVFSIYYEKKEIVFL